MFELDQIVSYLQQMQKDAIIEHERLLYHEKKRLIIAEVEDLFKKNVKKYGNK